MHESFDGAFWEEQYRTSGAGEHAELNPVLVAETADLEPGAALDAGCGTGAGAIWLASRGWHVTAVDIASTALDRARGNAELGGAEVAARIEWLRADLTTWRPERDHFDLVSAFYVHTGGTLEEQVKRLAAAVAPGGTLLIVGHGPSDPDRTSAPRARFAADQVADALEPASWDLRVSETRPRTASHHSDKVTVHDAVVRARKQSRTAAEDMYSYPGL